MGSFHFPMHFRSDDANAVRRSAAKIIRRGRARISRPVAGWVSAFPSAEAQDARLAARIAVAARVEHAIVFSLHDGDVLRYWYIHDGELADYFNSCPDYFGKATKVDLAATGNPGAFNGLLGKPAQTRLPSWLPTG